MPQLRPLVLIAALALLATAAPAAAAPVQVYSTDFEAGLPSEFSAPGAGIEGVQGYAGLGLPGRQFGGSFLRYASVPLFPTVLTVRNLPVHDHLSVRFLLAIIDSWDSTEIMQISVDGVTRFAHRFSLALADTTTYTPAPPGSILSMGTDLGFSGCCYYNRDRAYDLGAEPAFLDIPHTADSVVVAWTIGAVSGPAAGQWQGGGDESWAIDALRIEVDQQTVGVRPDLPIGSLVLAGAVPNPSRRGTMRVSFALPSEAPATLELLDVTGRRVLAREVGSRGPGAHVVSLDAARVAPGLYFVRLTQGTATRTARVAVID